MDNSGRGRGRGQGRKLNVGSVGINTPAIPKGRGQGNAAVNDFFQATSNNLPTLNCMIVAEFFFKLRTPEQRQVKREVSSGADYGDSAVGYVKIEREKSIAVVEAKVTPQTSVNNTPYNVSVRIDEVKKTILQASCDCQASMVNCKRQTALVFWILRRSEEPSPTEVACYWRKSHLSAVKGIKCKSIDELSGVCTDISGCDDTVLKDFIRNGETVNTNSTIVRYSENIIFKQTLYMDHLIIQFIQNKKVFSCINFLSFYESQMSNDLCDKISNETREQSSKAQWYYLRFGRITASKLFEASRCKTEGSLVASVMGSRSFKGNAAKKRGQKLEIEIFDLLKRKYKDIEKCGIVLTPDLPQFGASPDGVSEKYVFEIKCPTKKITEVNYVQDGILKDKVFFQIQVQMFMCRKEEGIIVIASPEFEKNRKFTEIKVKFNWERLKDVLLNAKRFWERSIFPILK